MGFSFNQRLRSEGVPLLFLPGWGFDARLLKIYQLIPEETLIVPDSFVDPHSLERELLYFLKQNSCDTIRIAGWSLGAQLGLDFYLVHSHRVKELVLLAMRKSWPAHEIEEIRQGICRDMKNFMRDFYRKCFLGYKKAYQKFTDELQDQYLSEMTMENLLAGLDYLQNFTPPDSLPQKSKVRIIHGRKDVVAPIGDMAGFPGVEPEIYPHSGHMVLIEGCVL